MDFVKENFEQVEVDGTKYGMKVSDGIYLPNGVMNLSYSKCFKLRDDDIFVSSFPKSGKMHYLLYYKLRFN